MCDATEQNLLRALKESVAESERGGAKLTVDSVCKRAGVSRATGNRYLDFMNAYRTAAAESKSATTKSPEPEPPKRDLVSDLRRTINLMATKIYALSVAYEIQERRFTKTE